MIVLFDGTPNRPMGRQLFSPEHARQVPVQPSERPATTPDERRVSRQAQRTSENRAALQRALASHPQTQAELVQTLGWGRCRLEGALVRGRKLGFVKVVGQRAIYPPKYGRRFDAVWGLVRGDGETP